MKSGKIELIATILMVLFLMANVWAQTTAFNYQGRLTDGGNPANGNFQMQFKLFDALSDGVQIGATLTDVPITATNGVFSTKLDFGANALSGANRWLEIAVRHNSGESYTTLTPREQIASSPYAVRTLSASVADNALQLGGIPASEYLTTTNGGNSFIRNGTTQQTGNLNISGNGIFGKLGIGTNNPFYSLEIVGNLPRMLLDGNGLNDPHIVYQSPTALWYSGISNGRFQIIQFLSTDRPRLVIGTNGYFGIGTFNPEAGLDLRGAGFGAGQRISDTTSGNSLVLQAGAGVDMKLTGYNYNTNTAVPLYLSVDGANTMINPFGGNLGIGTQTPQDKLDVDGRIRVSLMGTIGSNALCRNGSNQISFCSSSLRYKANIFRFSPGISFVNRLRPITFDWKDSGVGDVGFGAEDIEKIDPRFVTYNHNGEVEGVKYDRLSVVFVNAFKEQQVQIENQRRQIVALTKLVCKSNRRAEICKEQ